MADPLASPKPGELSSFVSSFATNEVATALLRKYRRESGQGNNGSGPLDLGDLPPSIRILVQNNTGADLPSGSSDISVLALSGIITGIADADGTAHAFAKTPCFSGTTPTATTDAFCILDRPLKYEAGGVGELGKAVIQGVVPVDVNVTDSAHGYATPTASNNQRLTSAASGPARILYKPPGTGVLRCVVKLDESGGSAAAHEVVSDATYSITSSSTWLDTGFDLDLPAAGTYVVHYSFLISLAVSSAAMGDVQARFWNETTAAAVDSSEGIVIVTQVANVANQQRVHMRKTITVDEASTIRLEVYRSTGSGAVYTLSSIQDNVIMDYLKVG